METRSGRLEFPPHTGPHTIALRVGFSRPVLAVEVALAGYEARFTSSDNEVRRLQVMLHAEVGGRVDDGWEARLVATLQLQDDGNSTFQGWIDYLLFVELGKAPIGPDLGEIGPIRDVLPEG
jgi:hypothetical protein